MRILFILLCSLVVSVRSSDTAFAHCDTMDGPVITAGQKSLDSGNLDFALIWILPAAEVELRMAFKQAQSVRKLGAEARQLADRFFLETLVRLHRAGENLPYTGIKPRGTDVGRVIPVADAAIASGSTRILDKLIADATRTGIHDRFRNVLAKRKYNSRDVAAGRAYVDAYVTFMHHVERLYDAAAPPAHGHGEHGGH